MIILFGNDSRRSSFFPCESACSFFASINATRTALTCVFWRTRAPKAKKTANAAAVRFFWPPKPRHATLSKLLNLSSRRLRTFTVAKMALVDGVAVYSRRHDERRRVCLCRAFSRRLGLRQMIEAVASARELRPTTSGGGDNDGDKTRFVAAAPTKMPASVRGFQLSSN